MNRDSCGLGTVAVRGAFLVAIALAAWAPAWAGGPVVPLAAPRADVDGLGSPVRADVLGSLRGGDQVANAAWLNGKVEDNTAERVAGGSNTVTGGAFSDAAGINTLIQNSGTNVLIQNALIVNVRFGENGP